MMDDRRPPSFVCTHRRVAAAEYRAKDKSRGYRHKKEWMLKNRRERLCADWLARVFLINQITRLQWTCWPKKLGRLFIGKEKRKGENVDNVRRNKSSAQSAFSLSFSLSLVVNSRASSKTDTVHGRDSSRLCPQQLTGRQHNEPTMRRTSVEHDEPNQRNRKK